MVVPVRVWAPNATLVEIDVDGERTALTPESWNS